MNDNQETQSGITANFDNSVDVKEFEFRFKTIKDKATGEESKRLPVTAKLQIPSVEGIVAILENGGKALELLQSAVESIIVSQARSLLNDNENLTSENFPAEQCTWEAIANMPEAERKARGIPKETWDDFCADYVAVMPELTGKTEEQVSLAAALFGKKLAPVKTNKKALAKLKEQLAIYANGAAQAETYFECIKFLDEKIANLLVADDAPVEDVL